MSLSTLAFTSHSIQLVLMPSVAAITPIPKVSRTLVVNLEECTHSVKMTNKLCALSS